MATAPLPASPGAPARRTADAWRGLFDSAGEHDLVVEDVEGALPPGLVGTLYRNGPGQREHAQSFFDGDGMIRSVRIAADGSVRYRSRLVETDKLRSEGRGGRLRHRTAGTNRPGGILGNAFRVPAHTANTSVVHHAEALWALEEGGHPTEIDPDSLATRGMTDFGGALARRTAFTAHPHVDPTGELYGFGMFFGKTPELRAFHVDRRKRLEHLGRVPLPGATFVHDYGLTKRWMAFMLPPIQANVARFLLGLDSFFGALRWAPERGTRIALLPRAGGEPVWLETDAFMVGHTLSAFDDGDEVVMDVCRLDAWDDIGDAARNHRESDWAGYATGAVWRYRFDPKGRRVSGEPIAQRPTEFPRVNPARETESARFAWLAANTHDDEGGWFRAIARLDRESGACETHDFGPRCATHEPVFVARPGATEEDDGWVVAFVHDTDRGATDVAVLDARRVGDGPICTIHLPVNAGLTFHGAWVPAT